MGCVWSEDKVSLQWNALKTAALKDLEECAQFLEIYWCGQPETIHTILLKLLKCMRFC